MKSLVLRLAKKEKEHVFSQTLACVTMNGSYGSIAALGQTRWFVDNIKAHNTDFDFLPDNGNHLNLGSAFVIGKEVDESTKVIQLNITSQHFILNISRSVNSG